MKTEEILKQVGFSDRLIAAMGPFNEPVAEEVDESPCDDLPGRSEFVRDLVITDFPAVFVPGEFITADAVVYCDASLAAVERAEV